MQSPYSWNSYNDSPYSWINQERKNKDMNDKNEQDPRTWLDEEDWSNYIARRSPIEDWGREVQLMIDDIPGTDGEDEEDDQ